MRLSFVARNAVTRGPRSAADWRNTVRELSADLSNITALWNTYITPLMPLLPDGTGTALQKVDDFDNDLNAFVEGLDGSQLFIDADTDASEESGLFWNTTRNRPYTLKEQVKALRTVISDTETALQQALQAAQFGLTASQKALIGSRIFGGTSLSTSLDGMINTNIANIESLELDIYNSSTQLTGSGAKTLTYTIRQILTSLLALHNVGAWQNDPATASHAGVGNPTPAQTDVQPSGGGLDDLYTGVPGDLLDDLNTIRRVIRQMKGYVVAGTWDDPLGSVLLTSAGVVSSGVRDLFDGLVKGQGTQTNINPWGYRLDDVDGGTAAITFTGMSAWNDNSPTYSSWGSQLVTQDGWGLERAVGAIDNRFRTHHYGPSGAVPSGVYEHWTDAIQVAESGVYTSYNNQPYDNLQNNLDWMCDPTDIGNTTQNTFRRQEYTLAAPIPPSGFWQINHNRGVRPIVQTYFREDPGGPGVDWWEGPAFQMVMLQPTENEVIIYNAGTVTIPTNSGVAICLW